MSFLDIVERAKAYLTRHERVSLRALRREFGLDDEALEELGLLVTFDSPSQAIACSAELAYELASVGLTIRAGLHAGEVEVRANGDITGFAVAPRRPRATSCT